MASEQPESMGFSSGPPRPGRRRRWIAAGATVLAAGVVAGAVLAGLGVAGAGTPSPSRSHEPEHEGRGPKFFHGQGSPGWFRHGMFGHGPFGHEKALGGLHGSFTVPVPGGETRTVAVQGGTVTSVSDSSITVKSTDGYSHTYGLGSSTVVLAGLHGIGDVKNGDLVRVTAVGTGASTRTVNVFDWTALRRAHPELFSGFPGGAPEIPGD